MEQCGRDGCTNDALADISVLVVKKATGASAELYFCSLECVAAKVGLTAEEMREFRDAARQSQSAEPQKRSDDLPS